MTLAVKRITNQVAAKELLDGLDAIGNLVHMNVVRTVGFCIDDGWFRFGKRGKGLYICSEYFSNGSLETHIFGTSASSVMLFDHHIFKFVTL